MANTVPLFICMICVLLCAVFKMHADEQYRIAMRYHDIAPNGARQDQMGYWAAKSKLFHTALVFFLYATVSAFGYLIATIIQEQF